MRRLLLCLALVLVSACRAANNMPAGDTAPVHDHGAMNAPAPAPATVHPGTRVEFASSPGNAQGYLAVPSTAGKHPALVVVQEWWGVNDWLMGNADRFAAQGYVAVAVDLYRGKSTTDPEVAHELMRGMPEDRAMADLQAGVRYLASRPDVDPARIGTIGWCMGGGYALRLATAEPSLAAAVVNYGSVVTDSASIAKIQAPLLGNYGADDRGIAPADVEQFASTMKSQGKSVDVKIYPGAGHGFMNPNNTSGYDAAAAADAWTRINAFLSGRLKPQA